MKRDMLIYFTGKLLPAVVNLLMIILAVRLLGEAEYGRYSLIFFAAMLLCTFTFGWVQQGMLRFLSDYSGEENLAVNRFLFLTLASSLAGMALAGAIGHFYFRLGPGPVLVTAAFVLLFNLLQFHLTLNQVRFRSGRYAVLEGTYYLLFLGFFLAGTLWLNQRSFLTLFIAMVFALAATELSRVTLLPGAKAGIVPRQVRYDRDFIRRIFRFGFPITLWLFLAYLWNISDRFIIKEFLSYREVGVYTAVKEILFKVASFSTLPVLLSYHPRITEHWNRDRKQEALRLIREGLGYLSVIAGVLLLVFLLMRNVIYRDLMHLEVSNDLTVTAALLVSAFLWQAALLVHKPLELLLKPGLMIAVLGAAFGSNIAGNILLVPVYGYAASAVVSSVSAVIYLAGVSMIVWHHRKKGLLP